MIRTFSLVVLGTEPRLTMYKATALPLALFLWPLTVDFFFLIYTNRKEDIFLMKLKNLVLFEALLIGYVFQRELIFQAT